MWIHYLGTLLPLLITRVSSFPDGAPGSACVKHKPNHGAKSQPLDTLPFDVQASASTFKPGDSIAVRIKGPPKIYFKGFFVQANDEQGRWIGTFEPTPYVHSHPECSAITHRENKDKHEIIMVWHAPKDREGKVTFLASILKSYKQYWVDVPASSPEEANPNRILKYIRREEIE